MGIPLFPTRSTRACALLAGLVAGTLTASTAVRSASGPPSPATGVDQASLGLGRAAVVTAPRLSLGRQATNDPEATPAVGELRRQEAAVAEWEYRRGSPAAASRSAPRLGALLRPAPGAQTSTYGERRGGGAGHPGIDIDGNTGDPIVAAAAGVVSAAGPAPAGYAGYGNIVIIEHGGGISTLYAHLSRVAVRVGESLGQGDYVGAIGTSGHVTGSHLHFEVRVDGQHVNPGPWLAR